MELREKIVSVILQHTDSEGIVDEPRAADAILAIPEIKLALAYRPRRGGFRNIVTKEGGREFIPILNPPPSA